MTIKNGNPFEGPAFSKEREVMFARSISMRLKPNSIAEFIQTLQNEIDPLLRTERGFRGHIAFVVRDGTEAVAISFWDRKQGRISHNDGRCRALVTLAKLAMSPPHVRECAISNSTSDNGELLRSFVHVEGVRPIEIYEVSRSIFRAIAAEGLANDYQREDAQTIGLHCGKAVSDLRQKPITFDAKGSPSARRMRSHAAKEKTA